MVEFNEDGSEGLNISNRLPSPYRETTEALNLMSAKDYDSHVQRLEDYKDLHSSDLAIAAELMDINELKFRSSKKTIKPK